MRPQPILVPVRERGLSVLVVAPPVTLGADESIDVEVAERIKSWVEMESAMV